MDETLQISLVDARKLIAAGSGDAALLYLYLKSGADLEDAAAVLHMSPKQLEQAAASLRQLGLIQKKPHLLPDTDHPVYSERDVARKMDGKEFSELVGELQRVLGRVLSTEDLKILLGMTDYLGLSTEVISILVNYCVERNRARGNLRAPSLRNIEKEAYHWADHGIDTMEQAAAFVQNRLQTQSKIGQVRSMLQLSGRRLTQAEESYIRNWLDMGFDLPEIQLAYERTCLNTGGLKWQYMNKILLNWHNRNLHSLAGIQAADHPVPAQGGTVRPASPMAKAAIARLLQEETNRTK